MKLTRSSWIVVVAALAVLSIGLASEWPVLWMVIAWPLGTLAVLGLLMERARQLDKPPSVSLLLRLMPRQPRRPGLSQHIDKPGQLYVVLAGEGPMKLDNRLIDVWLAGPDGLEFLAFGPHHEVMAS